MAVPISFDHAFLRRAVVQQVFTEPDETASVWHDASGCNLLTLKDPQVDGAGGRLRIVSQAHARIGTALGAGCLNLVDWRGSIEVLESVAVDPEQPILRFAVVDSNLYGEGLRKRFTGTVWDWIKSYVHPRLASLTIDLHEPVAEVRALLPLLLARQAAARVDRMLASLRLEDPTVADTGLQLRLAFELPERTAGPTPAPRPEPTLGAEELRHWEEAWQRWDAFLTFVIKHAAGDTTLATQRKTLFAVLIDARYDLLDALAPSGAAESDPVRGLFLRAWAQLAPALRDLSAGLPGEQALHHLSFVAAGDALVALDQAGPDLGIEISADGLRRLARTVAPASTEDPLRYDTEVDPVLQELFGLGRLPGEEAGADEAAVWSWGPAAAWAADDPIAPLAAKLKDWAPTLDDLARYLPLVRSLLHLTAEKTTDAKAIPSRFRSVFRSLVLATAWQESCWRQFVRKGADVRPLTSAAGSVGLMQVSQHVWRGFYDLDGLRRRIEYNALAGAEILALYLKDYAIAQGEHQAAGRLDDLARATYAAYNGGPSHLHRYRKSTTPRSLRRIDAAFWSKYQRVRRGDELAVAECF